MVFGHSELFGEMLERFSRPETTHHVLDAASSSGKDGVAAGAGRVHHHFRCPVRGQTHQLYITVRGVDQTSEIFFDYFCENSWRLRITTRRSATLAPSVSGCRLE